MGLSIATLVEGREITHDVKLDSLEGESIKMREMRNGELTKLFDENKDESGEALTEEGTKLLFMATVTDDDGATMTREQVDMFFESSQKSVIKEIIGHVNRLHGGTEAGES
ncbi:hypothetical protein [uncultured Paraglaciecola sp.]|uniref:hypothetical protein n=1 Tax=uncultured Paraglaciecola sp. TaxID=1765024 RepID=UPI0026111D65|nr:hypothetical protein [uncultured Paraglaciecola sp.]